MIAWMYNREKAITEYSMGWPGGSNDISHWYSRPSIWLAATFFG
jgi:hypothetical protein